MNLDQIKSRPLRWAAMAATVPVMVVVFLGALIITSITRGAMALVEAEADNWDEFKVAVKDVTDVFVETWKE